MVAAPHPDCPCNTQKVIEASGTRKERQLVDLPITTRNSSVPSKLGRYEIRRMLGEGGMARVFEAYDPEIDRKLAIKVLQPELERDSECRGRFLREARGAGILSHPNIVTIFDAGEVDDRPYFAMEYVDGETLADVNKRNERFPVKDIVEIGIQLTKALNYAHCNGIIHRDVKPGNIMILADTKTVKVADFGICRIEGGNFTRATRVGDVLGTPNYMSPEQIEGKAVDARSDLFSAGIVLYQLLTGTTPFEGETFVTVAMKILRSEPEPLDKLRPDLPLSLRRAIDRSLRKQPEKRFQSGAEMAQALIAVAREISEKEKKTPTERHIPMGVRWAVTMFLLVVVTMSFTGLYIHQRQSAAMLNQAMDFGASMVKFIASQAAVPMLSEDWPQIEVFIQDSISRQGFSYLQVIDYQGILRGSSVVGQTGKPFKAPVGQPLGEHGSNVKVQRYALADQREVIDFETPIMFQDRTIGVVRLGLFASPLQQVANLTLSLLGLLILVTSIAVAVGSYLLGNRFTGPVRILKNSLSELAYGRFEYRIAEKRHDEFGELYSAFDATAAALQQRYDPESEPSPNTAE